LSVSAIETYQKCPQKYLFGQVWGIRSGPSAATTFGNVMHVTIRQFIAALRKGVSLGFDEVAAIFRREWTSAGFEDRHQEDLYLHDGMEQLRAFHASMLAAPPHVIGLEKRFTLHCDNGVELIGRMDQINRIGAGEVEIIDYKTGKPKSQDDADESLQLSLYALAAREAWGLRAERLIFHNLEDNTVVVTTRDGADLEAAKERVRAAAEKIAEGKFPAKPGYQCSLCPYRNLCPATEKVLYAARGKAANRNN
jgi:ATP-dependent DNA helicase UvrD/PcrA